MKTNLNNFWHTCSWRNLQQNYMEQMSDLFVEHRYFKFQDEIQFFQCNNGTLKHRTSESFRGCNKLLFPRLASTYLHDTSLLMSRCSIIIFTFSQTYLGWREPNAHCLAADDAFTGFRLQQRSTMLSISGTNICIAAWKWVDVTSNILL